MSVVYSGFVRILCILLTSQQPLYGAELQADHLEELAPFYAYKVLGESFKWMFVGEDDTLFFKQGAWEAVQDADPDMPYLISGNVAPSFPN